MKHVQRAGSRVRPWRHRSSTVKFKCTTLTTNTAYFPSLFFTCRKWTWSRCSGSRTWTWALRWPRRRLWWPVEPAVPWPEPREVPTVRTTWRSSKCCWRSRTTTIRWGFRTKPVGGCEIGPGDGGGALWLMRVVIFSVSIFRWPARCVLFSLITESPQKKDDKKEPEEDPWAELSYTIDTETGEYKFLGDFSFWHKFANGGRFRWRWSWKWFFFFKRSAYTNVTQKACKYF